MNAETKIMNDIQAAVNATPYARLYRNNVGLFFTRAGNRVHCGLSVGSGDLIGFTIGKRARFISIEVKTPTGKVEPDQTAWMDFVNKHGGYACVARSVQEALEHIKKANE